MYVLPKVCFLIVIYKPNLGTRFRDMTVTLLGICIVIFLLIVLSAINFIMSMFNNMLFKVLKILLPISLATTLLYHIADYLLINFTAGYAKMFCSLLSKENIDVLSGVLTTVYLTFIVRRTSSGIFTKVLTLLLLTPMILYLLNSPIEYVALRVFRFSVNEWYYNIIYSFTAINYFNSIYTATQTALTNGFRAYITDNATLLTETWTKMTGNEVWRFVVDNIGLVITKFQQRGGLQSVV
ncbi:hypothetical protein YASMINEVIRUS_691 [Yasminevirus sp. GU-2018]|uniref:Uncharacterized protein n=1 Tax=Yasminevirus sp. GU-2018 TaxID=2420051 RepID=A0A5K0U871_9VIRU|nr:hypothetical protein YASMINEVIRUS_691 [Yasminevirus sp. GU-2018]